jgi:multimeric flavodoxin WrbA
LQTGVAARNHRRASSGEKEEQRERTMNVMAFNGSPRKNWNTASLLQNALEGAASEGAETELIHLYDLDFKGCTSCFACKTLGGKSFGRCAMKDELTPILGRVTEADAVILGAPIYYGTATGVMRMFMERLLYPVHDLRRDGQRLVPKKINTGLIYTMNIPEKWLPQFGFDRTIQLDERFMGMIFGACETLLCTDTFQFEDYSKMAASLFDAEKKAQRRKEVFPVDCEKARDMGVRFARDGVAFDFQCDL